METQDVSEALRGTAHAVVSRTSLRVLMVEDSAADAQLELMHLEHGGYDVHHVRVETREDLCAALIAGTWDIVISDCQLPNFTGFDALHVVRELCPDLPFIVVSGTLGEDAAVHAIKAGADEYVLKDNIARLSSAVSRELRAAAARREFKRTQLEQALLAHASERLSESIDYAITLRTAAQIALPRFADWCTVDMVEEDDVIRRMAFAHVDPRRHELGLGMLEQQQPDSYAMQVASSARSLFFGEISESVLNRLAKTEAQRAFLSELGLRSLVISPLKARGQTFGAICFASTRAERTYSEHDVALAEELAQRAALALDNANLYRKAREAVRVRDDFLSIAAHELRTPIASLQLLLQGLTVQATDKAETTITCAQSERAERSIRRLTGLVESLLDVSRISSGAMTLQLEALDLKLLAKDVVERLKDEAARANSQLVILADAPVIGMWDRIRLEQVLMNLLGNALKYAAGKPIDISIGVNAAGMARIEVIDRGIGIPRDSLTRIFGRFERAVPVQHYGGLGLGLYVSHRIVEAHDGTITASSEPGCGATFAIELPCRHR